MMTQYIFLHYDDIKLFHFLLGFLFGGHYFSGETYSKSKLQLLLISSSFDFNQVFLVFIKFLFFFVWHVVHYFHFFLTLTNRSQQNSNHACKRQFLVTKYFFSSKNLIIKRTGRTQRYLLEILVGNRISSIGICKATILKHFPIGKYTIITWKINFIQLDGLKKIVRRLG